HTNPEHLMTRQRCRAAAAAVELAILLPFLTFVFLVAIDYCRLFYYTQVVTNCARNGALWASDPTTQPQSPYASVDAAARADADPDVAAALTVTSTTGSDSIGSYTDVTVQYSFQTFTSYPGIPTTSVVTRTARVRPAPATPK